MGGIEAPMVSETTRAAVYARTSSPSQQFGYSIDEQVRQCAQQSQMQGWEVHHVFRDRAKSGKDTDRPMFQQMLSRAKRGTFDVLVFWKLDRLSRSIHHAVELEMQFREWNIALHSVTEQLDTTTPAGQFNFRNIANAAEFEREMIKQRTKMGHAARAIDGKWPNATPPLGYEIGADGRLEINEGESALVRQIFKKYTDLRSMPAVVEFLDGRQSQEASEREWTPPAISKLLQNQLYVGIYSVGDVEKQIPDYRIVSDDLFDRATEIRTRFRSEGEKRGTMPVDRKKDRVNQIRSQYEAWLE